jgi:hypothetical protein
MNSLQNSGLHHQKKTNFDRKKKRAGFQTKFLKNGLMKDRELFIGVKE